LLNRSSRHDPLSFGAILAFTEVAALIPDRIPVILEARVAEDQIKTELDNAQKALSTCARIAVPA
jgi:hypothetical protein